MSLEDALRNSIEQQLQYCDPETTPKLCELLTVEENRDNIKDDVVHYVKKDGLSIAQAIVQVERDYNPNLMND